MIDGKATPETASELDFLLEVDRRVLPDDVDRCLGDDERVLYWAQPIRHSLGIGVWMIFFLGPLFGSAGAGAVEEILSRMAAASSLSSGIPFFAYLLLGLALLLLLVGVFFLSWPLLSSARMRRTHILVTTRRVLQIVQPTSRAANKGKKPKVKEWAPSQCDALNVVRRRGQSASLVLTEKTEERRSDGRTVYRWEALHGIPRARQAMRAIKSVQHEALRRVHSAV